MVMKAATQPETLTIPAGEFKAKCLSLLDQVLNDNLKVIVTKRGKVVAEITQPAGAAKPFRSIFGRSSSEGSRSPNATEWKKFKAESAREWEDSHRRLVRQLGADKPKGRKAA